MKNVIIKQIPLIDLTPMVEDLKYGVSVYRGVLIVWDEDHDNRVVEVIDQLLGEYQRKDYQLLVANESEGHIKLIWDVIPDRAPIDVVSSCDNDVWSAEHLTV